jgi:hypothetical protein
MLRPDDYVERSNELARAIWALGMMGAHANGATIARYIRAKTPLNWEGPQASRFFRKHLKAYGQQYFAVLMDAKGRSRFCLTAEGQAIFEKGWSTEGPLGQPRGPQSRTKLRSEALAAARDLVTKMEEIHQDESFQGIWTFLKSHGQEHAQLPTYQAEFEALQTALGKL